MTTRKPNRVRNGGLSTRARGANRGGRVTWFIRDSNELHLCMVTGWTPGLWYDRARYSIPMFIVTDAQVATAQGRDTYIGFRRDEGCEYNWMCECVISHPVHGGPKPGAAIGRWDGDYVFQFADECPCDVCGCAVTK